VPAWICSPLETKFTLAPSRTHDAVSDSLTNTSKAAQFLPLFSQQPLIKPIPTNATECQLSCCFFGHWNFRNDPNCFCFFYGVLFIRFSLMHPPNPLSLPTSFLRRSFYVKCSLAIYFRFPRHCELLRALELVLRVGGVRS